MFSDSKVKIRTEGKRHLDAAIGTNEFRIKYVTEKVNEWCEELKPLPNFAKSQSQALYAAVCFAEQNKHSYFLRTIPSMSELMKPVEEVIQNDLLANRIESALFSDMKRAVLQTNERVHIAGSWLY